MGFYLKGITNSQLIEDTMPLGINGYSFDLRPKSFNFVQLKKIKEFLNSHPQMTCTLLYENEQQFMVESIQELLQLNPDNKIYSEYTSGNTPVELEKQGHDFVWHYQSDIRLSTLANLSHLKRIVLHHQDLERYHANGELYGFLQLFSDIQTHGVEFELLIDWDTDLIESMFEYFQFDSLSWEINSKVEKSYQNPDIDLICSQIQQTLKLFT